MKCIIASDVHGSAWAARIAVEAFEREQADRLLLLGDILYHGPRNPLPRDYAPKDVCAAFAPLADRIIAVGGNCDAEVDEWVLGFPCLAHEAVVADGRRALLLTHGHRPHLTPDDHPLLAPGSVFCSGHTHVKALEQRGGIVYVNPGSLALPKDDAGSYAVYDGARIRLISAEGAVSAEIGLPEA